MTNDKIAAVTAQFSKDIPEGSVLVLQQSLKNVPDEAFPAIVATPVKSVNTVIILSLALGLFGVDRFYLGDTGLGVAKLLLSWATWGIWSLIDIYFCYKKAKDLNYARLKNAITSATPD